MKTETKEFGEILAALGERELSDWERQRLWKLIADDENRIREYVDVCRLNEALGEMDSASVADANIVEMPRAESSDRGHAWAGWAAAALMAILAIAALFSSGDNNEAPEISEEPGAPEDSPEASYQKMLVATTDPGSQKRPPTQFVSLKAGDLSGVPEHIEFNEHVRPILSEYCFACHGPDSAARKADLRLDQRDAATADGAVVPGDARSSEVVTRMLTTDPDEIMPPPESHKTMKPHEQQIIARWIDTGAEWQDHWSFISPQRPQPPAPDGVEEWARNEIDHFILDEMQRLGLEPNAEAGRYTLARRLALDLTGLPPSPKLLDAFITDESPDAYEKYVTRLLASEHGGEHRARYWLDAARYGDTHGMHLDNYREIWPYRDWVIDAFNSNMPFDQFVIEQIAGDLLPEATLPQRIATGFNRCNVTTAEGGSIPEELNVRYMNDRVETTATVFLGLTAGCAACHDHKFDPITMRDFYSMGAFFNNTTQPAMDGNQKDSPPVVVLPKPEFEDEWNTLRDRRAQLRRQLATLKADTVAWWESREKNPGEHPVKPEKLVLWLPLTKGEGVELAEGESWESDHLAGERGVRFEKGSKRVIDDPELAVRADQPLTVSFWVRTPDEVVSSTLFDYSMKIDDKKTAGWKITTSVQGALTFEFTDPKNKSVRALLPGDEALTPRTWQHVCIRYSGGQSNSSFTIFVNGEERVQRNASLALLEDTSPIEASLKIAPKAPTAGLSDVRIFKRWISDEEAQLLAREFEWRDLLAQPKTWNKLDADQKDLAALYHRNAVHDSYHQKSAELAKTQLRRDFIYARSDTTLVMQERQNRQPRAWILERGEYDKRADEVRPAVPDALPSLANDAPRNRLGLARWLVADDQPLTARVTVNRLWQSIFGTGLVKTAEDFGVMGDRPSHPELLDWLAVEFMESGWDVNHILTLIVTSATYRQDATISPDELEKDPDNRYLARGPRFRLDAEVLRDQALAVSGLLESEVGGPSVKPYQPEGLWKVVAFAGSNTREFKPDSGNALYRRSLYTFWKRTSPPPSMAAFNAPTREQCTVRRERTNTPLQALVLMNDPQFVEAARHLAGRALRSESDPEARAEWMLRTVLARPAEASDLADVVSAIDEFRQAFAAAPEAAKSLIQTGDSEPDPTLDPIDLATWTMIANTLMNRDDFVNKS